MAYRRDADLEFLSKVSRDDLNMLAHAIIYDKDNSKRLGQTLDSEDPERPDYWQCVAEQIQKYGANTVTTLFRFGKGVQYREVLYDVCDKLNVSYKKTMITSSIEDELLKKVLRDVWEKLSDEEKNLY